MEEPFPGKVAKRALALGLLYLLQQVQKKSQLKRKLRFGHVKCKMWNAERETQSRHSQANARFGLVYSTKRNEMN